MNLIKLWNRPQKTSGFEQLKIRMERPKDKDEFILMVIDGPLAENKWKENKNQQWENKIPIYIFCSFVVCFVKWKIILFLLLFRSSSKFRKIGSEKIKLVELKIVFFH